MSQEENGFNRRHFLTGAGAAVAAPFLPRVGPEEEGGMSFSRALAQGVKDRLPSRHGYPNVLLTSFDPLEGLNPGFQSESQRRWHQRLILLAEDAYPRPSIRILENWAGHNSLSNTHMHPSAQTSLHLRQAKLIAGAAMVYLRNKDEATPAQRAVIEPWLKARGTELQRFYDSANPNSNSVRPNHFIWAGLAAAATGMATSDNSLYSWGRNQGQRAINLISENGTIPNEQTAWEVFNPLFSLAHLSLVKRDSLYAGGNAAKLEKAALWGINRVSEGIANGTIQSRSGEQRAGTTQKDNIRPHDHALPFAQIYLAHIDAGAATATRATRAAAEKVLRDFGYEAARLGTGRGRSGQREEVPVHNYIGGAASDVLSIGQPRAQRR